MGLDLPKAMLGPLPLTPRQVCLHGSGVPREGHSPWDFASIMPGSTRTSLFHILECMQEQLKQQRMEAAEQLEQVMIDADLTVGRAKGDLARLKSRMSEELTQEQEGSQKLRQSIESMKDATKAS